MNPLLLCWSMQILQTPSGCKSMAPERSTGPKHGTVSLSFAASTPNCPDPVSKSCVLVSGMGIENLNLGVQ